MTWSWERLANQGDIMGALVQKHVKHFRERHKLFFTDISIRDVVLHLGNYSRVWEQLVSVYPRVNMIQTTIEFVIGITNDRSKYYFSMETGSQKSL